MLEIGMMKNPARTRNGRKNENKTEGDKTDFLKNNCTEIGGSVFLFLLGPDAHHRRNNQSRLKTVYEHYRHPRQNEYSEFAQAHEAGEHHVGQEIRCADYRLIGQSPEFPSNQLPKRSIAKSLCDRVCCIHPAPEVLPSRSMTVAPR